MGERRERHRRYRAASWEEKEREREKRGKRERKQVGFCLLKEGVQHMYTAHTAGQGTACVLDMHAGDTLCQVSKGEARCA